MKRVRESKMSSWPFSGARLGVLLDFFCFFVRLVAICSIYLDFFFLKEATFLSSPANYLRASHRGSLGNKHTSHTDSRSPSIEHPIKALRPTALISCFREHGHIFPVQSSSTRITGVQLWKSHPPAVGRDHDDELRYFFFR